MYITNNHASFHLWWKKSLVKYQKVLKYYVHDCLQNFLLLLMFLLTAPMLKTVIFWLEFTLFFWKTSWSKLKSLLIPNLDLSEKIGSHQVRQDLALFNNLLALILNWNCVKSLVVTKIVQKIMFERDWDELEANNCFQRQWWKKYIMDKVQFSCEIVQYGKILISIFHQFLLASKKIGGRLGTRL